MDERKHDTHLGLTYLEFLECLARCADVYESNSEKGLDKKIDEDKKDENLLRMSQNVFYKKPGYTLKADIIEIDLITKNSKIYMNTDTKKVVGTTFLN